MKHLYAIVPVALLALVPACRKPTRAQVACNEHPAGFSCAITTTNGGSNMYNVCWDIDVTCVDGQKLAANTCQDVNGDGRSTALVPGSRFTGGRCQASKVAAVSVLNVKVTRK
jgi:hypothetical protein